MNPEICLKCPHSDIRGEKSTDGWYRFGCLARDSEISKMEAAYSKRTNTHSMGGFVQEIGSIQLKSFKNVKFIHNGHFVVPSECPYILEQTVCKKSRRKTVFADANLKPYSPEWEVWHNKEMEKYRK